MTRPLVLLPACSRQLDGHAIHMAGHKYVDAVRLAGCTPLVVPVALPDEIEPLLDLADGVLLTGSESNVHPVHFNEAVHDPKQPLDPARDAWTLPLVRAVVGRGMPLFAICRGHQEMNVALGGSLFQAVHEATGPDGPYADHRPRGGDPQDVKYGPAHPVDVVPGGILDAVVQLPRFDVNSLHGQAVKRLAPGLRVEARSADGVIEAFSVAESKGFALGVQWHPEWKAAADPVSMRMLQAFGAACRRWQQFHRREDPSSSASDPTPESA